VNRQLEPHAHCLVLDPYEGGKIAFVPDLGLDVIRQYRYSPEDGSYSLLNEIPSAQGKGPHGPRYLVFHSKLQVAYVVNELSSFVTVFSYNRSAVQETLENNASSCQSLELIQQISTIPEDYEGYNTCGRICIDETGKFVLVSNRGHDSITSYSIDLKTGQLTLVGTFSTQGETPRHFQFHPSGELLCAANQDSDDIVMFDFDTKTGELKANGQVYKVPSPNFVQFVPLDRPAGEGGPK